MKNYPFGRFVLLLCPILAAFAAAAHSADSEPVPLEKPFFAEEPIFVRQEKLFYRIPTLVVTQDGTVIAAANERRDSSGDFAQTTLVARRRPSGGAWGPLFVVGGDDKTNCVIGSSVYDTIGKRIFLFGGEMVFISDDDGKTFRAETLDLTPHVETGRRPGTHGSGPGVTLRHGDHAGRLLVPARFALRPETAAMQGGPFDEFCRYLTTENWNCAIFSDDRGQTWKTSGSVQLGTGEGTLAELGDGRIYYNSRTYFQDGKRRTAISLDGGETFGDFGEAPDLIEPPLGCNGGLLRIERPDGESLLLFSGPQNLKERTDLTLMASRDDGRSWRPIARLTPDSFGAYSALAWSEKDQRVFMLYETNKYHPGAEYGEIVFAEFNLAWIEREEASH